MSIIDRYIAREFWKAFFSSLLAFTALFVSADSMRQSLKEEIPASYAMQYTLYQLPEIIVLILPAACLMGTLICLSGLGRRSELVAMYASGISLARIGFILLCLVFMTCCFSFVITDRVVPPLSKKRAHFYRTVIKNKPDLMSDINQNKIWYRSKNLVYNLRAFDPNNNLIQGIVIYTFDQQFKLLQQISAKLAKFTGKYWELQNGFITIFTEDPKFPLSQSFKTKPIFLSETPEDFKEIERKVETLRLKYLWRFIEKNKNAGIDTHAYETMFWSKISMSLIPMVMAILAIPFASHNYRHSSVARDVSVCFLLIVMYWLLFSTALSMGKSGSIPPLIAAWFPSFLFFAMGMFLLFRRKKA